MCEPFLPLVASLQLTLEFIFNAHTLSLDIEDKIVRKIERARANNGTERGGPQGDEFKIRKSKTFTSISQLETLCSPWLPLILAAILTIYSPKLLQTPSTNTSTHMRSLAPYHSLFLIHSSIASLEPRIGSLINSLPLALAINRAKQCCICALSLPLFRPSSTLQSARFRC